MKKILISLVCFFLIGFSLRCFAEGSISDKGTPSDTGTPSDRGTPSAYLYSPSLGDKIFYKIAELLFGGGEYKEISYYMRISSPSAKNITIYFPFVHYKGKPDKRIFKWLKEYLNENYLQRAHPSCWIEGAEECAKVAGNIKLELIDTEYGKMVYMYIPKLSPAEGTFDTVYFRIGKYTGDSTRSLETNPRTMLIDYKLTYEDKIKPQKESQKVVVNPYDKNDRSKEIRKILNMPIYVQFEGEELEIYFSFGTEWGKGCGEWGEIWGQLRYNMESPFTTMGWHWIPIEKETEADLRKKIKMEETKKE